MLRKKPGTNEPHTYSHSRAIGENPPALAERRIPRLRLQPIPNSFLSQRLFMAIPLQLAVHKEALRPAKLLLKTDKNPILILLRGACMSAAGWERGEGPIALVVVPTKQLKRQEQRARDFQGQRESSSSTHHVLRRCAAG